MTVDELMALADEYVVAVVKESFNKGGSEDAKAALRSALEQVVADSERYRWLREQVRNNEDLTNAQAMLWNSAPQRGRLDAAIDTARKASNA
jgi:hypothetical protein